MGKALAKALLTPVGTGEMLTSAGEVERYIEQDAVDLVLHDAPRIGGITPFLKVAAQAQNKGLMMSLHLSWRTIFIWRLLIHWKLGLSILNG